MSLRDRPCWRSTPARRTVALLAISDAGALYVIDPPTGAASAIGDGIGALADPGVGFDVDPTTGSVRVVVATGEQVLLDAATGAPPQRRRAG